MGIHRTFHTAYQDINTQLTRATCILVDTLQEMPLAQGVIIFMAFSMVLGTLAYSNIEIIAQVTRGITLFIVMSVGALTLWLLALDRRKSKNVLELAVVLLMLTNIMYLFQVDLVVFGLLHDVTSSLIILSLFFTVAHGVYKSHPELRYRDNRRRPE